VRVVVLGCVGIHRRCEHGACDLGGSSCRLLTAWITPSHVDEAKPDFDAIVKSFHETAAK
jgi:hypothetical protein